MKIRVTTVLPNYFDTTGKPTDRSPLTSDHVALQFPATGTGANFHDEIQRLIDQLAAAKDLRQGDERWGYSAIDVPISVEAIVQTVKYE